MIVKYHADSKSYTKKPSISDIKQINNRITKNVIESSIEDLAQTILNGQTIIPSYLDGCRKQENFKSTNLIFLDFDNSTKINGSVTKADNYLSITDCLNMEFTKNNASFLYETFSSSTEIQRFRLVFKLDKVIESNIVFKEIYESLLIIYPQADTACNDCARIFFGGKSITYINKENTLNSEVILKDLPTIKNNPKISHNILIPSVQIKSNYIISSAMKENNREVLKDLFKEKFLEFKNTKFESNIDMIKAFNKLNMYQLFGLPTSTFCCVIIDELNPSCSVMQLKNGDYIYKRYSENNPFKFNNFQLLRVLFKTSFEDTITLIEDLFSLDTFTKYDCSDIIDTFIESIFNKDLKRNYPRFSKLFYQYRHIIKGLFQVMYAKPVYVTNNYKTSYKYISTFGTRTLAEKVLGANKSSIDTKRKRINRLLLSLTYINVLTNLNDDSLDDSTKDFVQYVKKEYKSKNRLNVYQLNISNLNLNYLEKYINENIPTSFSVSKISTEFILLNKKSDEQKQNVIVQSDKKKITKKTTHLLSDLDQIIKLKLLNSNYILDKELKLYLESIYSKKFIKTNYINVISKLTLDNNYERNILTKELRENLKIVDIPKFSSPMIIYHKFY